MDVVVQVNNIPRKGETILGKNFSLVPGGKGANQAVSASRAGSSTKFFGCVGDDIFGKMALSQMDQAGVDISGIRLINGKMTGFANIILDAKGENRIIIIPGANEFVTVDYIDEEWKNISKSKLILIQHEIPLATLHHIIKKAKKFGLKVILNPAPFFSIPSDILKSLDFLILNEIEASALFCSPIKDKDSAINAAIKRFPESENTTLIITLGNKGAVLVSKENCLYQPAFNVKVIDTTAAGDTFVGSFASSIISSENIKYSLLYASAAAALAVTKLGAQTSIPNNKEIMELILNQTTRIMT